MSTQDNSLDDGGLTFTPGPWAWFGNANSTYYLATTHSGRCYVMSFARKGMQYAEPQFQVNRRMVKATDLAIFEVCPEATSKDDPRIYRADVVGFRSADAKLIEDAPELYKSLGALHSIIARIDASAFTAEDHQAVADAETLLCKHTVAAS